MIPICCEIDLDDVPDAVEEELVEPIGALDADSFRADPLLAAMLDHLMG